MQRVDVVVIVFGTMVGDLWEHRAFQEHNQIHLIGKEPSVSCIAAGLATDQKKGVEKSVEVCDAMVGGLWEHRALSD